MRSVMTAVAVILALFVVPARCQELIFADGFESGDTGAWSATEPPAPTVHLVYYQDPDCLAQLAVYSGLSEHTCYDGVTFDCTAKTATLWQNASCTGASSSCAELSCCAVPPGLSLRFECQ